MNIIGTREAAKALGISHSRLIRAVWDGRIDTPKKVPGGAFGWTDEDINHASWALLRRAYEQQSGGKQ